MKNKTIILLFTICLLNSVQANDNFYLEAKCTIDIPKYDSLYSDYMYYKDNLGFKLIKTTYKNAWKYADSERSRLAVLKKNHTIFEYSWTPEKTKFYTDPTNKARHELLINILKRNGIVVNYKDTYDVIRIDTPQNSAQSDESEYPSLFLLSTISNNKFIKVGSVVNFRYNFDSLDPEKIYPCKELKF